MSQCYKAHAPRKPKREFAGGCSIPSRWPHRQKHRPSSNPTNNKPLCRWPVKTSCAAIQLSLSHYIMWNHPCDIQTLNLADVAKRFSKEQPHRVCVLPFKSCITIVQ